MAQILERVFAVGGNRKYLTLNNQEFTRKLNIGNDWTMLRIGLLAAMPTNGTIQATRVIRYGFGIGADSNGGFNAASTTHWVGFRDGGAGNGVSFSYNAGSGNPYYLSQPLFGRKIGTSLTTANVGTIQLYLPASDSSTLQRKWAGWLEITRGYTVQTYTCSNLHQNIDCSYGNFLQAIETVGATPTVGGQNMSASTSNTLTGDDTPGELNTISMYWGSDLFPLEIYGIAVYRVR